MTYQVLARKYRPRTFAELVGQEHVSRALTHALDQDRLHHAYLFSGTRGCGKTTIARILAKCLNCEQGVSAQPCGVCDSCREIAENRFVDLIEVDAASRTKVEDTRELLDNVQYAPTRGRYKVYLIDEVHMLSAHSFNALLKTLEEPPPHVKFLLATTDPQKLPVTILSRCLQFNLKALPAERIATHLQALLEREMIPFEAPALLQIGRAARGSMRDALSLTDQAIAFSGEQLNEVSVGQMLGNVDRAHVMTLLRALADGASRTVLEALDTVAEQSPDELSLLDEIISTLHRLAVAQAVPAREQDAGIGELAAQFQAEQLQLFYDVAVRGRRDLADVPDARAGLEMVLLRMLLFRPEGVLADGAGAQPAKKPSEPAPGSAAPAQGSAANPTDLQAMLAPAGVTAPPAPPAATAVADDGPPWATDDAPAPPRAAPLQPAPQALQSGVQQSEPLQSDTGQAVPQQPETQLAPAQQADAPQAETPQPETPQPETSQLEAQSPATRSSKDPAAWWAQLVERLDVEGVVRNLARNCVLTGRTDNRWHMALRSGHQVLASRERIAALEASVSDYLGRPVTLDIQVDDGASDTPDELAARRHQKRLDEARQALTTDATVCQLITTFSARLEDSSIEPPAVQE
ncbi:DNA polymerase III subunit gamma/tau [Alcanivorax sp. JB21]|uniref:DNA polymerase III subunit gamma/tau n=1 Tax=Alcanivorax limicola TaxID=2874102 RepID=UPI001CBEC824|nr:DNA polymerase III subunit gamma/tau [Alcanivorax limicola]MBZ2188200.1 DNA polymerase III subunit gamma/tau [Alcanivorax limicola]